MPSEPPKPDLRASDADRESAVERLRAAALEGRLEHEELESRLEAAYGARTCAELTALTADITPPADPLVFLRPAGTVNPLAIVSVVAGMLWLAWLGSIVAIVAGHMALHQIRRSAGTQTGRAPALAGLCFGYCEIAALLFVLSFR